MHKAVHQVERTTTDLPPDNTVDTPDYVVVSLECVRRSLSRGILTFLIGSRSIKKDTSLPFAFPQPLHSIPV